MENVLKKVQTEIMYEVEFEGDLYTVMQSEDGDHNSGYCSWDVYDDDGNPVDTKTESQIINFVIENM